MTVQFEDLGLAPVILKSVRSLGFEAPTPIQRDAIPLVLTGRDLMGLAQTGTGKTAAFGLPLVHHLMDAKLKPAPKTVRALILAPTRELVSQIAGNMRGYVRGIPLRITSVTGGASINVQIKDLAHGADILVATPGRLIDLTERRALSLGAVKFLVLDEADQMLDLGFIHALRQIARMVGTPRQTLLFSATMPKQIEELSRSYLTNPARIEIAPPGRAADKVRQSVHFVGLRSKATLLKQCLTERPDSLSLVFTRTKHGAERLMKDLTGSGLSAASIHGNKNQNQRDRAIREFRNGEVRVLVATDVAARGIDIPGVSHVYNFDLPEVPENYVHRIGRTARAGADGEAVALCGEDEFSLLRDIERLMGIHIDVASGERPERPGPQFRRGGGGSNPRGRQSSRPDGHNRQQPRGPARQGEAAAKHSPGIQPRKARGGANEDTRAVSSSRPAKPNSASPARHTAPNGADNSRPQWRRRARKSAAA
jgi:ATP-dependent RNA helicase RhlE